jgi:hypothetical protein
MAQFTSSMIETIMKNLRCTEEEAQEVMEADKRIDKGEKLFELPDDLKAGAKKARQANRKPTVYKFDKRERKPNNIKKYLIELLAEAIPGDVEIINDEREFSFIYQDVKYKITLSCPRS